MIRNKLGYLLPWRRRAAERDLQEELDSLARMAEPAELGNLTLAAENARRTWQFTACDGVLADVRYAFRTLCAQPGFVAVALITLGLGIGANTAIFSFADAILLRPLPVDRPSEILSVAARSPENAAEGLSYPDYRDYRAQSRLFSGLIAYRPANLAVAAGPASTPQVRLALTVSDNFFDVLGIVPSSGRAFLPEEGRVPGRDTLAVLGHDFWTTQYGGDPSVVGRKLRLNGIDFTIIGVAPESFSGMDLLFRPAIYVPLSMWSRLTPERTDPLEDRARHELTVKGRVTAGASLKSAAAEAAVIGGNLARAYPAEHRNRELVVRTEIETRIQQAPVRLMLVTTLGVLVGLVLIIACANIANLMLARARARSREIAIRLAIGAGRLRLVRQLMTENLLVALLGGLAGLGFADAGMKFLSTLQVSSDIPIVMGLKVDTRVLLFSLAAALVSCFLFGLAPAMQAARTELVPALKSGDAIPHARRRIVGRDSLVVAQIAFAMVLLTVAALYLDGSRVLLRSDPGFRSGHLIGMGLDTSVVRYSDRHAHEFYAALVASARTIPGVKSIAMTEVLPYSPNQSSVTVIPEGYRFPRGRDKDTVFGGACDEKFFSTMKVPIVRGRAFDSGDRAASHRVAIVNEEFAKTYWPNQDPIGKRLRLDRVDGPVAEVVGIAKTGRYLYPTEPPRPYVYLPYEQNQRARMTLIAEAYGDPAALAAPLRDAVRAIDADQPVLNLRTLEEHETRAVNNWLIFVQLFAALGIVGFVLAMAGLYGLISYSVSRRTSEIGVRMAIGATRAEVQALILRQGLLLAAAGIAIGGVLAALAAPALAGGFLETGPHLAAWAIVPLSLLITSAVASYVPARRAATLDPIRALWHD